MSQMGSEICKTHYQTLEFTLSGCENQNTSNICEWFPLSYPQTPVVE